MVYEFKNPENGRFYYLIHESAIIIAIRGGLKRQGAVKQEWKYPDDDSAQKALRRIVSKRRRRGYELVS